MNQLKSLEMQGFKSFPDKTRLTFGKGITAVVGPNGSGKSNISDAVRWVLGEQSIKTLRGSKMEDVIFNGTVNRKPVGFAQVSLTIDNQNRSYDVDADEVVITRRLYRSGESEYRINNAAVRLKDIHEMFMDTGLGRDGYSMIGQGKISEIVSAKPTQRREIFEEAAGISKFRYKKEDAERRLAASEENILRLMDILSELEERVGPLEEQSKKAKKYLELVQVKKELEVSLWIHRLNSSNNRMKEHEDKIFAVNADYEALQQKQENIEQEVNAIYEDIQKKTVNADNCRRETAEIEEKISQTRADIAVLKNDITHCREAIQKSEEQLNGLTDSDLREEIESVNRDISENQKRKSEIEEKIAALREKSEHSDTESRITDERAAELNRKLNQLYNERSGVQLRLASGKTLAEQLCVQVKNGKTLLEEKKEHLDSLSAETQECRELVVAIQEKLKELTNMQQGYQMKISTLNEKFQKRRETVQQALRAVNETEQRIGILKDLERNMDGFSGSVKAVIRQGKEGALRGIKGSVAQLIRVESEIATAIETALGAAMQNIVVEDENAAKAAINYLKRNNIGRATFLPLTSVRGNLLNEKEAADSMGYVGIASELVSCDEKYRPIIRSLLGRTVLVQDLDNAVSMAKKCQYKFRIVTLDGQIVNAGGSMTGGSAQRSAGILSRADEINRLTEKLQTLQKELSSAKAAEESAKAELDKFSAQQDGLFAEINTARRDEAAYTAEYNHLQKQRQDLQNETNMQEKNLSALSGRLTSWENEEHELNEKFQSTDKDISEIEVQLSEVSEEAERFVAEKKLLSDQVASLNLEKLSCDKDEQLLREKIAHLTISKENVQNRREELETEIGSQKQKIDALTAQILEHEAKESEFSAQTARLAEDIRKNQDERQLLEQKTVQLRAGEKDILSQRETLSGELARLEERKSSLQAAYDKMIASLWDEYELTRSQAETIAKPVEDENKTSTELNGCKNKIRALGNVNVDAIEEYKEVSQRYTFLKTQLADVEKSKSELKKLISEVTEKMRTQFSEKFEKINHSFKTIFSQLFEGGQGELQLVENEDILECGIDIKVQPPGKIIKNIAALSGGEQSMIAIAIYFAILTVNPSPFCILDEIEAALDDVNVARYAAYLRRMSEKTQFIAITHRRGTMEEADILYGVTMQDEGVSKVLELNVSELESKMGKIG